MGHAIDLRSGEREKLYYGLHDLAMGNGTPFHPGRVPSFNKRAKELADQLWAPPDEWTRKGLICDNFDLWIVYNGCFERGLQLTNIAEIAIEEFDDPRQYTGSGSRAATPTPYSHPKWRENREEALQEAAHVCEECGMTQDEHLAEYEAGLHVHHIKPIREFEEYANGHELDNLMVVCASCHGEKHGSKE